MNKASNSNSIKGLSGLSGLSSLASLSGLSDLVVATDPVKLAKLNPVQKAPADEVRVQRETKGRGGKAVTLVKGISLPDKDLDVLGKQLKTACGSGGTVKDGVIEVQGDHVDRLVALLKSHAQAQALNWNVKRAGG